MDFLTICNRAYVDFAINLSHVFQQPFMALHNLIIECLDDDAVTGCDRGFPNISIRRANESDDSGFCDFNSPGFVRIQVTKLNVIQRHLMARTDDAIIWYVDGDIVFFQDPAQYADGVQDILAQTDEQDNRFGPYICAGNMVLRATATVRAFISQVLAFQALHPHLNDQEAIRSLLSEQCGGDVRTYPRCKIGILPIEQFQSGYFAFHHDWWRRHDKVCVHANFLIGRSAKLDALRRCGGWLI